MCLPNEDDRLRKPVGMSAEWDDRLRSQLLPNVDDFYGRVVFLREETESGSYTRRSNCLRQSNISIRRDRMCDVVEWVK